MLEDQEIRVGNQSLRLSKLKYFTDPLKLSITHDGQTTERFEFSIESVTDVIQS